MIPDIRLVTLGVAAAEADHRVREEGGNNRGPRIRAYLENIDPPITVAAPWCAAFVQYCSDLAARTLGVPNPLDEVRQEALVQSYYEHLMGNTLSAHDVSSGDLVLFKFGTSDRWNHIGLIAQPPRHGGRTFWTVEGNTSDESQRDGDAVAMKPREIGAGYPVAFITWAEGANRE